MLLNKKIVLFALIALFSTSTLFARIWETSTNTEVKNAIAKAKAYDTIAISGLLCFNDALLVDKPLTITSFDFTNLDFQCLSGGIMIISDSVIVKNLEISNIKKSSINDFAAIHAEDVKNVTIINNKVLNAFFGIYLANCKQTKVFGNEVLGYSTIEQKTGNAIHLWHCDSMLIDSNYATNHRDGVYLEFVTNTTVINNTSIRNIRYGLHFMFSHDDVYQNNSFIENSAGVAVMYSRNVSMINNRFKDNWGDCSYGLLLKDITDGQLKNNDFDQNTIALLMEGTNRLEIENNTFKNNGWALKIAANCEGNVVENNVFDGNSFDVATNGHTVMNEFNGNYWDNYEGYDLDRDGVGDVPYHPVSLFSVMVERVPESLMLYRSFLTFLLDKSEHVMPSITPADLVDNYPKMSIKQKTKEYACDR